MKSVAVWMCVHTFLLLIDEGDVSRVGPSPLSVSLVRHSPGAPHSSGPGAHSEWVDCIQASEMCNQNPNCSSRYRVMRQCLVGKEKDAMLDNNRECQAALEVLLGSPLYDCRCKRGMKKELQCLQNYWTIHMGLGDGGDVADSSPYEPVAANWQPDTFRLASISSGMLTVAPKGFNCLDPEKNCNPCLDAAKACNLNGSCKRQRSTFIGICIKEDPNRGETCSRKRCHKALRSFLDRVPPEFSHRLLFCPCQTEGCAERRRQTIVPDCSYNDKDKPNCLELRTLCRQDSLCRSRLADYTENCRVSAHTTSTCPNQDNHQACLSSYARLIGTDMTPNYVDNSFSNWTISPWCTCEGSGNQEEECYNFLRFFTENTCLRNAVQAFGYGADNTQNKNGSLAAPSVMGKPGSDWTTATSEPALVTTPKFPEPRGSGLGKTGGLSEDHAVCLGANLWALVAGLASALLTAQQAS
eukprot:XP_003975286.1 PREDICTED: GDNF family receptor alpha-2-like [Takifugu rubripes]